MTTFEGEEAFAFQRQTLNFCFDLQIQQPGGGGGVDRDLINGLPQVRVVQLHRDNEKGLGFTVTEAGQGGVVNVALITPGGPAEKVRRTYCTCLLVSCPNPTFKTEIYDYSLVAETFICMSQQLGNEVERQGKANKSTTPIYTHNNCKTGIIFVDALMMHMLERLDTHSFSESSSCKPESIFYLLSLLTSKGGYSATRRPAHFHRRTEDPRVLCGKGSSSPPAGESSRLGSADCDLAWGVGGHGGRGHRGRFEEQHPGERGTAAEKEEQRE